MINQIKQKTDKEFKTLPHNNIDQKSIFFGSNLFPINHLKSNAYSSTLPLQLEESLNQSIKEIQKLKVRNSQIRKNLECANIFAHSLKSPLSAIKLIAEACELPTPYKKLIKMTCSTMEEKISEIQLLDSIHTTTYKDEKTFSTDLPTLLSEICENIKLIYKKDIEVSFDYNLIKVPLKCRLPINSFKDAIFNIVKNSFESIEYKGHIFITMYKINSNIEIVITDSGKGIPQNLIPFLGQKCITYGKKKGTGIGLYQVKKMMDNSAGEMKVSSVENKGTQVKLIFPLTN